MEYKIELINIEDIKEYERNPKLHPLLQIKKIRQSIEKFGFRFPILLNNKEERTIVAGHGRFLAAKELDYKQIPCFFADDMSEEQITAFRIIDNKVSESSYNSEFLMGELKQMEDEHLEILGLTKEDIESISINEEADIHKMSQSAPMFEYRLFFLNEDEFSHFIDLSTKAKEEFQANLSNSLIKLLEKEYGNKA